MIYQIGSRAWSTDVTTVRVEKDMSAERIQSHGVMLDNLTARLEAREEAHGSLDLLDIMKGEHNLLRVPLAYAPASMPLTMCSTELSQSVHSSGIHKRVVVAENVGDDDERAENNFPKDIDEDEIRREENK
ncbi:hypothetical protein KY290_021389 [Solanum tuberosum]|uniref:Integrase core domain containing protein n=1 Tax=Solanum tuberosum TaxID=4113 RepID=A0ABQ7V3F1_SOLTU|nr:hypothetical protein KY289_020552 [Solanum tuberosum]KAH0693218.1 hypothetical protein KY285_020315 [Solanum tuberosum]KAH0757896.1 hypothetical protein KY290_021389 [Solanum tuberosum]